MMMMKLSPSLPLGLNTSDIITILNSIVPETVTQTDLTTTKETSHKERSTVNDNSNSHLHILPMQIKKGKEETTASNDTTKAPEIQDSNIEDISNDAVATNSPTADSEVTDEGSDETAPDVSSTDIPVSSTQCKTNAQHCHPGMEPAVLTHRSP